MAKTQWNKMNAETRKDITLFATTYAKHVDEVKRYKKSIKGYESAIATDREDLNKYAMGGSTLRTIEAIRDSLATNLANIEPLKKAHDEVVDECKDIEKRVYTQIPTSLHTAYVNREDDPQTYDDAIINWGKSVGVDITPSTLRIIRETIGDKESDGRMRKDKSSMGLTTVKYEQYARMFTKKIAKLMGVKFEDESK